MTFSALAQRTAVAAGLSTALISGAAFAQSEFPSEEIRIIVPYGPGGASDQSARVIADLINSNDLFDEPVIVSNLPGAGTREGLRAVQSAEPDGHTLLLHHNAFIPAEILGQVTGELTWHEGFTPVAGMMDLPMTITVLADSEWETLDQLVNGIAANPGEIRFGFPGINVPSYLGTHGLLDAIEAETGESLEIHEIFFEGGAATKAAHMGGQVDVVPAWTIDAISEAQAGEFRVLAVGADQPLEGLDAPTFSDTGVPTPENNAGLALRVGVFAPADTPEAVVSQLEAVLEKVFEMPEWSEFAGTNAGIPVFRTSDEMQAAFEADTQTMSAAAEAALEQ